MNLHRARHSKQKKCSKKYVNADTLEKFKSVVYCEAYLVFFFIIASYIDLGTFAILSPIEVFDTSYFDIPPKLNWIERYVEIRWQFFVAKSDQILRVPIKNYICLSGQDFIKVCRTLNCPGMLYI